MPITAITIENFKGIGEPVRIELKPITLLFGPNSAGKSTIIQALHFAREVFKHGTVPSDSYLGGFKKIVHNHDKSLLIKIGIDYVVPFQPFSVIDFSSDRSPLMYDGGYNSTAIVDLYSSDLYQNVSEIYQLFVEFSVRWSEVHSEPFVYSYKVAINGEHFAEITSNDDASKFYLTGLNLENSIFGKGPRPREASDEYESREKRTDFYIRYFHGFFGQEKVPDDLLYVVGHVGRSAIPNLQDTLLGSVDDIFWPGLEEDWSIKCDWEEKQQIEGNGEIMDHLFTSLMATPRIKIRDVLFQMEHIGPLREIPDRDYRPGHTSGKTCWANGLAEWNILHHSDKTFIDKLNGWLSRKDRLNLGYEIVVKRYREIEDSLASELDEWGSLSNEQIEVILEKIRTTPEKTHVFLREEERDIELSPEDIGVGISQIIPVLVAALKGSFVAIEQPELHVHPALQVVLGDLFIVAIEDMKCDAHPTPSFEGKDLAAVTTGLIGDIVSEFQRESLLYRRHRFILETHSEHLLLRLLRRIWETNEGTVPEEFALTPNEVSIYFIEKGEKGTTALSIRVDKEGEFIDRWPRGFFDERVAELY